MNHKKEYIICSAIWYDDEIERVHLPKNIKTGIVASGLRHCNCNTILNTIYPKRDYILKNKNGEKTIQGFLTSKGNFVNRIDGAKIAYSIGQIDEEIKKLHSEDLY